MLDTCTSSCPENCTEEHHLAAYSNPRADKFRELHLEKVHENRHIPASWQESSWIHDKSGWTCRRCGFDLGTWHDNADGIGSHFESCALDEERQKALQKSFNRLSFEAAPENEPVAGDTMVTEDALFDEVQTWNKEDEKLWGKGKLYR